MIIFRSLANLRQASLSCLLTVACAIAAPVASANTLDIDGGATLVYQQETNTGSDDVSVSGDLTLNLPTTTGRWFLYIEGATGLDGDSVFNTYPEVNGDAGSVQDRDSSGHIQVSELFYEFKLGEQSSLTIGQIDVSGHIDRSAIANDENTQFLGNSFINNATIQFPDYTAGAIYRRAAVQNKPELTVVVSASKGIADIPSRSYRDLVDIDADGNGIFAAIGARWIRGNSEFGAGAWSRTDQQAHLDDMTTSDRNYGVFVVYDRVAGARTFNARAGIANRSVSRPAGFASIAYQWEGDTGTFGIGLARIFESSAASGPMTGDTTHAEAWYRVPVVRDSFHVSADLQYVRNPGFDRSGINAEASALFVGLRLDYVF